MKKMMVIMAGLLLSFAAAGATDKIDVSRYTYVAENHAAIAIDGVDYILDSYIIPFKQPYYVTIERKDGKPIEYDVAVKAVKQYIEPRGCTDPIKHPKGQDQHNKDNTQWLIVILC